MTTDLKSNIHVDDMAVGQQFYDNAVEDEKRGNEADRTDMIRMGKTQELQVGEFVHTIL